MEKTRIRLMLDHPFFGILALSLQLVRKDSVGTLSTNGRHIFYNPAFIESLSSRERVFVFMHEIGHVILLHMFRRDDRDPKIWNVACDYAVNFMIKDSIGTIMPEKVLYDVKYKGMSAEEIYESIIGQIGSKQDPDPDLESGQGPESGPGPEQLPKEIEDMIEQARKHGMIEDAPKDLEQHDIEATISTAAAVNQLSGTLGIGKGTELDREIERLTSKKVPWQAILQKFITETCQSDYSWMKPNLKYRQVSKGFILPSLHAEKEIKMVVVFDTSGSINEQECSQFFTEFLDMLEAIDFKELHVLSCSDRIFNPKVFHKGDDIRYRPAGRGGTESAPVWRYLSDQGVIPNCVVYFTDLQIFDFGENPGYPVVWVANEDETWGDHWEKQIPFGEVVRIN